MVIYNAHFRGADWRPSKDNPPLIVNADGMIARAISMKCLQSISGRNRHIMELTCPIELNQFSQGHSCHCIKSATLFLVEQPFGISIRK